MDAVWIGRNGTKHGPYPAAQVLDAHTNGKLQPADLLWWQGLSGWVSVDQGVQTLRGLVGGTPSAAEAAAPTGKEVDANAVTASSVPDPRATARSEQAEPLLGQPTAGIDPYRAPSAAVADPTEHGAAFAYAGFWVRCGAFVLDTILMAFLGSLFGSLIGFLLIARVEYSAPLLAMTHLGGIVIGWLYYALLESSETRATLGKMAFRLQVVRADSHERISFLRATGRFAAKFPSAMLLGVGYLMQPFTARKQAMHDLLSGVVVIETAPFSRALLWVCLFIGFIPLFVGLMMILFVIVGVAGPVFRWIF